MILRIGLVLLLLAGAAQAETLPFSQDFDGVGAASWISSNSNTDNGSTVSLATGEGWGGSDAVKLYGPTICTDGNGQDNNIVVGIDSTTAEIHFRYLIKVGDDYWDNSTASGCTNFDLKHIETTGTATRFISSVKPGDGEYGLSLCNNSTCKYENGEGPLPDDGNWWPEGTQTFNWGAYAGEWVCLEYEVDATNGDTHVYVWSQDGAVSGLLKSYTISTGGGYTGIEIGNWYNHRLSSQTNAEMLIDELVVSTSYIGPPAGFVNTSSPTVSITTSNPQSISADSLTVTGTASDSDGLSSCKWNIGSPASASVGTACTGTTSFSCSTSGYSSGANNIHVGCVDTLGNYGGDSIVVDYTPAGSIVCYPDADNDLYPGSGSETVENCSANYYESSHFTAMTVDCNDNSSAINPGATEICGNGTDEDCSGADLACQASGALISNGTAIYVNSSGEAYALPE